MSRYITLGVLLALIAGTLTFFTFKDEISGTLFVPELAPSESAVIAHGEQIYAEYCASCHGANLEGQPSWKLRDADGFLPAPPHKASGHTWHHDDASLFAMVKQGVAAFAQIEYETNMPAFEGVLSDKEIHAVLSFIKSTWPEHIQERHNQINYRVKGN